MKFLSYRSRHCGFNQWATNSRIVHAVADTMEGPYTVTDVPVGVWAHNPAVVRGPNGEWIMTYVANDTADQYAATCRDGRIVVNSTLDGGRIFERNYMSVAHDPAGPWSTPVRIDDVFDATVAPFVMKGVGNHNTNLIMSIAKDGSMVGLWRRCCTPGPKYRPPGGGGGASVIFGVRASNWSDTTTWVANATAIFPQLKANGFEDPHIWADPRRKNVYHAVFHDMVGGWHQPEFPNIQVGAHAYSADSGRSWVPTGIAYNLTVAMTDGSSRTFVQRERPHIVVDPQTGQPIALTNGVTYSLAETLPTCTIVQPIAH